MALPVSGPITATDIQAEFGGTNPFNINDYYKGGAYVLETDFAPNVPRSGPISFSDFYGARKTSLTTVSFTNPGNNLLILPATFVGNIIVQTMTGGGGGGGGPDSFPGRAGYPGLTITGGNIAASPGDVVNAFVGAGGGAGGSGGGGGGGGKIICTKLYELGLMPSYIFEADEKFGQYLKQTDPDAYNGYVRWARVVVDWMEHEGPQCMFWITDKKARAEAQKQMAIRWARRIATPWSQHMAYRMGVIGQDNWSGKLIMKTGLWISRLIGKHSRITQTNNTVWLGYVMWMTFGVFWLLATVGNKNYDT